MAISGIDHTLFLYLFFFYPTSLIHPPHRRTYSHSRASLTSISVPLTFPPSVLLLCSPYLSPCLNFSFPFLLSPFFFFDALHCTCACCTHTQYLGITTGANSLVIHIHTIQTEPFFGPAQACVCAPQHFCGIELCLLDCLFFILTRHDPTSLYCLPFIATPQPIVRSCVVHACTGDA